MLNGQSNGQAQQTISVNPQQAAAYALQFIAEVAHTRQQREAYDIAVGLLQAIVNGQVQLMPTPQTGVAEATPKADER